MADHEEAVENKEIECVDPHHGHAHHDEHHHHLHDVHSSRVEGARYLIIAMIVTGAIVGVEVVGGILSNSLALLSDAGHVFTDFLALLLSYVAFKFASKPATERMSFGFYRME